MSLELRDNLAKVLPGLHYDFATVLPGMHYSLVIGYLGWRHELANVMPSSRHNRHKLAKDLPGLRYDFANVFLGIVPRSRKSLSRIASRTC